jgi:hypothetical protein
VVWFDIPSAAFLSAVAETAAGGRFLPVPPAVPEFCADGDWIRASTVTDAATTNKNFLRSTLIVSSSKLHDSEVLGVGVSRIIPEIWPPIGRIHIIEILI